MSLCDPASSVNNVNLPQTAHPLSSNFLAEVSSQKLKAILC